MNAHVSEYDKKAVKFGKDGQAGHHKRYFLVGLKGVVVHNGFDNDFGWFKTV